MVTSDDMQQWAYLLAPTFQFVNTAGKPLTEGWMEVYIAGTRDKYYCASDFAGTLHPFQIPLDSLGANIVLADPSQAYDVYVYNKFGSLIMSRYHVFPSHGGGSSVLNITIESEDGTVIVNNDGNGNFDLSIKPTVDKLEDLINIVSGISTSSTVGYAIGHAYTVNLDNTINLINDSVSGIDYTQDMTGYRLKSGHVYQFNYNAKFECGENDRYCSGKFYLEGPNSIAQEWKFNLDDSYYHSQSFNGATVLVTPTDLQYYDVKLKYAWDVDYTNPPDIDLNKISIVDITTLLSTTVSGSSGSYTGGDGIFVNNETNIISVDMDYINEHLDIDATEIIASAVNVATGYTDARVTSVSGELVDLINDVSASIPDAQVQSDWTETDTTSKAYIQNKPNETTLCAGTNITIEVSGTSAIVSTTNVATVNDVTAVSGYLQNEIDNIPEQVQSNWTETDTTDPSYIQNKPDNYDLVAGDNIGISVSGTNLIISASGTDLSDYATHSEVSAVSGNLVELVNQVSASVPAAQVNADWTAVSGKAEILNKPQEHELIAGAGVSIAASGDNYVISAIVTGTPVLYNAGDYIGISDNTISVTGITDLVAGNAITITASGNSAIISSTGEAQVQSDWNVTDSSSKAYIKNKPTIPAAQVQSNWNETNTSSKAYIQNKPTIHTYTGASGISISSDVVTLDNPIGLVAVSGIEITVSGTSAIISASGIMDVLGDVETALANL